jgi:acetylornithine aminotransferase/acetylornithine/N-succinyldiaminopimelate aminotransferase
MTVARNLADREQRSLFPTYKRYPINLVEGKGCRLRDADGRTYLDFVSGLAVNSLGYRHPAVTAALEEGAQGVWHTSNLFYSEPQVALAERLTGATGMERVFFCNSGAEAVEAALKLARRAGGRERHQIVAAEGGFHGRTLGALSATASSAYREPFLPLLPGVRHVPFGDPSALESALTDSTAAVVLEAIQGEGGVRPAPPGYLEAAFSLCEERGALLILDEVQTGIGRTGTFLTAEVHGVLPHVLCLAKALAAGLPMGVMLARGRAAEAFRAGDHGSTFGGGQLISRVALAVLDEVLRPGFLEAVRRTGSFLGERLVAAARDLKGVVEVRGAGMIWGVEFSREVGAAAVEDLRRRGVLACTAGPRVLRLLPPLILARSEAEEGAAAVAGTLKEVAE